MTVEVSERDGAVTFRVRVTPRARKDAITGTHAGALKVSLTAPPVEGAANAALVKLLAKQLGIARQNVEITRGDASRDKVLRVRGVGVEAIRALTE